MAMNTFQEARSRRRETGLTLVELLIAMALTAVGIAANEIQEAGAQERADDDVGEHWVHGMSEPVAA